MKILVTGGAGFIGSHVVDLYLEAGHEVVVVDNLSTGLRENVNPAAKFYEADVTDQATIHAIMQEERPQVVNHHAAQVNVRWSLEDPVRDAHINVLGTVNVLEAASRAGVAKFIFISSGGAVYGEAEKVPTPEDWPPKPISHYGAGKLAGEHYCHVYYVVHSLPYVILRYANVYGPRQNPEGEAGVTAVFARMMLLGQRPRIFGDGTKTRDYVHVRDVARANLAALGYDGCKTFNIGTGRQISDRAVFDAVAAAVGYEGEPEYVSLRPGEVRHSAVDCSLAARELGWRAEIRFEEGVRSVVEYQAQRLALFGGR
ncbi:MAG: SDR family NAD(P)-dependent oxidoreductase [Armatimonadetes bacterium]|nr:SDR family NAD(P)-dependent oxidoreductase [Armatimonadota bacterium]